MAAACGKTFLIKVDIAGTKTTIAGLKTRSFKIGNEVVDITNDDSAGWRELLSGCGTKSASISGSGVFTSAATDAEVNTLAMAGTLEDCEVVVPGFGSYTGDFAVTEYSLEGEHNGEIGFSTSLESSGAITFTAE